MRTVGSFLREERLKQGLTLEMVSVDTRISLVNLEAIEADELGHFSSPFFYKSFVKQFAGALQLDTADFAEMLGSQATAIPAPAVPGEETRPLPDVPALQHARRRSVVRWALPAVSLLVVLVGCSGIYAWWEGSRGAGLGLASPSPTKLSLPAPRGSSPATKSQAANAPAAAPLKPDSGSLQREAAVGPLTSATGAIRLEVAAVEPTWVSVMSDGKKIYSGILDADQTKMFEGHESARIKTGNAAGVHVVFNGRIIGALGPRGQVRTVVFTPDNFEIVDPATHFEFTKVSRITE
jgi:cytoskeleton protein RodZ